MNKLIEIKDNPLANPEFGKAEIDNYALDILNDIPEGLELDYYRLIYKFEYLLKQLKDSVLKSKAKEQFIKDYHGATNEAILGFKHSLVTTKEYDYSDKVKAIEKKIKSLQIDLKAQKDKEKSDAKVLNETTILKLTML